ncbi:uncharacterized protein BO80DRAFT_446088 [Aspergillus ibericus CBS 121593]|uniref:Rhodopsin domain-containing protein n=1 Tax=Aspergillus ibericus CBS 121593 TaxID=1448316 RepID=A0A395GW01_9EURO|nr:hypothetical protein BO80DRAFT_446088 [Aspergillus ibericus CBS 121593]RAK99750.1 hypothetical protein BO80DRAFT_446088 [Aspergillus ibericus CBS 121593]
MASPDYYGGHGPGIVGVSVSLCCVATILLALRYYTFFYVVRNKGAAALLWATVAWALGIPSVILYCLSASYGLGNHITIVYDAPKLTTALLFEWIAANTICFSVWFAKLSTAIYILEVQGHTNKIGKWLLIVTLSVNLICYVGTIPIIFTQCTPADKLWDQTKPGNCNGVYRAFVWATFTGAWGSMTDLILAFYPSVIIWNLQLRLKLKLIISILMGLGVVTAVCSLIKTIEFGRLEAVKDSTYEIAPLMIYGMTEMWVVLIASSAAPLWPLVRRSIQSTTSTSPRSGPSPFNALYSVSRSRFSKTSGRSKYGHTYSEALRSIDGDSQDGIVPTEGIMLTRSLTVKHDA